MKSIAVIGAGFGDEGKGRVVSDICLKYIHPLVIRYSGGHQAAHHVVTPEFDHVFSNFGSGSFSGAHTYWSKYCTIDPIGIVNELNILSKKGCNPTLYIDGKCPVTTPYDKYHNHVEESKTKHGTCGVGFGTTLQREEDYYSLTFSDLFHPSIVKIKLDLIKNYYRSTEDKDYFNIKYFLSCCQSITHLDNIKLTSNIPDGNYDKYIFEGSQGLLLDQNIGFFPHVTRSNTGSRNILDMGFLPEILLVSRAYQNRHGNGPMTNEDLNCNIKINPFEQNPSDGPQGKFRQSMLDLDLLSYAISRDQYINKTCQTLNITCADLIDDFSFTLNQEVFKFKNINKFTDKISDLLGVEVIVLDKPKA